MRILFGSILVSIFCLVVASCSPAPILPTLAVLPSITPTASDTPEPTATLPPSNTPSITPSLTVTPSPSPNFAATQARIDGDATISALNTVAQATNMALSQIAPAQPVPTVQNFMPYDQAAYVGEIWDGLIWAGGREVVSVSILDGRPTDVRVVILAYMTTESTEVGFVEEWIDLFDAVAVGIDLGNLDVDAVSLIAGTATGRVVGGITIAVSDLMAFHTGELSRASFIARFEVTGGT